MSLTTVEDVEAARHPPMAHSLNVIRATLEAAGVEFVDEDGAAADGRPEKAEGGPVRPSTGDLDQVSGGRRALPVSRKDIEVE